MRPSGLPGRVRRPLAAAVLFSLAFSPLAGADSEAQNAARKQGNQLLRHLDRSVTWYQHAKNRVNVSGLTTDAVYQSNNEALAAKALSYAFQSARAEAALLDSVTGEAKAQTSTADSTTNLAQIRSRVQDRSSDIKTEVSTLQERLSERKADKNAIRARIKQLQSQLDLADEMSRTLNQLQSFVTQNTTASKSSLSGAIDKLIRSVPDLTTADTSTTTAQKSGEPPSSGGGFIGQAMTLFQRTESLHQIEQLINETEQIRDSIRNVQAPLIDALRQTVAASGLLGSQTSSAAGNGQQPAEAMSSEPSDTSAVERFRKISQASVPLTQELVILDQSIANLNEWRGTVQRAYRQVFRSFFTLLVAILIALGIVFTLSWISRWFIFRYVQELRRRRQLLLITRIVTGFLTGLVLLFGFVSQFNSLATFAGFITAGIAVGLQTLLLSVAAYFFILGRYGIRVGDRITVAGVTGDVVDVGLVRFYLKELAGLSVDLYPTGRLVAISNSVLFQAGSPLYKQLPGAEYSWHEVAINLKPTSNLQRVEDQIMKAVREVYSSYSKEIERQHARMRSRSEIILAVPEPLLQVKLADAGLEAVIRYPVPLDRVSEIDEKITRALVELIERDAEVQSSVTGLPKIRAALKS